MVRETLRENLSLYTVLIYDTSLIKMYFLLIHPIEKIFAIRSVSCSSKKHSLFSLSQIFIRIKSIIVQSIIKNKYV